MREHLPCSPLTQCVSRHPAGDPREGGDAAQEWAAEGAASVQRQPAMLEAAAAALDTAAAPAPGSPSTCALAALRTCCSACSELGWLGCCPPCACPLSASACHPQSRCCPLAAPTAGAAAATSSGRCLGAQPTPTPRPSPPLWRICSARWAGAAVAGLLHAAAPSWRLPLPPGSPAASPLSAPPRVCCTDLPGHAARLRGAGAVRAQRLVSAVGGSAAASCAG